MARKQIRMMFDNDTLLHRILSSIALLGVVFIGQRC
jgi:hypothetical protein